MPRLRRTVTATIAMVMALALLPGTASAQDRVAPSWQTSIDAVNAQRLSRDLPTLAWWGDNSMADAVIAAASIDPDAPWDTTQVETFYATSGAEVLPTGLRAAPADQDPKSVVRVALGMGGEALLDPNATHIAAAFDIVPNPDFGTCEPTFFPDGEPAGETCDTFEEFGVYVWHVITDVEGVGPVPPPFSDIAGTTHEATILSVHAAEITSGFSDGTFRPGDNVTRGQMATFLTNALDLAASTATDSPFSDVAGTTHEASIAAIVDANITSGFSDGTFRPGDNVTRGQMATFLTNALNLP